MNSKKPSQSQKKNQPSIQVNQIKSPLQWIAILFLSGALFGSLFLHLNTKTSFSADKKIVRADGNTYVSVKNLTEDFLVELSNKETFAVYEGKTWIPVQGEPIEVLTLNDLDCKSCDASNEIKALQQNISPALLVRLVDIKSKEGKDLIKNFEINSIPKFFLGAGIEKLKAEDGTLFIDNLKKQDVLVSKENLHLIRSEKVNFTAKKFISTPKFADLDTEPTNGSGKIQVIEFSDFQCPYSKRLHDQNKDLIAQLIKENKIKYTFKDFPLGFHAEAQFAHAAANCVLKEGGTEKWLEMKDKIFETQATWSGKREAAKTHMQTIAKNLGVDVVSCMDDEAIKTEITNDMKEGQKHGVSGTPALFIGTEIMPGAIGADQFKKAVESQL